MNSRLHLKSIIPTTISFFLYSCFYGDPARKVGNNAPEKQNAPPKEPIVKPVSTEFQDAPKRDSPYYLLMRKNDKFIGGCLLSSKPLSRPDGTALSKLGSCPDPFIDATQSTTFTILHVCENEQTAAGMQLVIYNPNSLKAADSKSSTGVVKFEDMNIDEANEYCGIFSSQLKRTK